MASDKPERLGGLSMMPALDLTGQRFGRLVAIRRIGTRRTFALWVCACDCGAAHEVTSHGLRQGLVRSCGCLRRDHAASVSHLASAARRLQRQETPTYTAAHKRLRRDQGLASRHVCPCGAQAAEWAYDHADPDELTGPVYAGSKVWAAYSLDPDHYVAMCVLCHRRMDSALVQAARVLVAI